jgi:hypothetical protein
MRKLLILSLGLLAAYKKYPGLVLSYFLVVQVTIVSHWNLNAERFWNMQPIAVFLNVFMNIRFSNIESCSLSLHI